MPRVKILRGLSIWYFGFSRNKRNRSTREFPRNKPQHNPKTARISELLANLDHWLGRLMPVSYGSDELLVWLVAKLPRELWDECRSTAERKARALNYEDLSVLLWSWRWRKKATST